MIWNMAPVLREEDEKNENVPKMLCQMDNHLGNCAFNVLHFRCLVYRGCVMGQYKLQ